MPTSDGAGGAYIVWLESGGEDCDLRLQHIVASGQPANGWPQEGLVLCAARGTQTQPVALGLPGGGALLAWKDYRDPDRVAIYTRVLSAISIDPASALAPESLISDDLASDPRLVSDGASGGWLLWIQGALGAREIRLHHLTAGGTVTAGWAEGGKPIPAGAGVVEDPQATADGQGGLFVAWRLRQGDTRSIRLQHLDASGEPVAGWPLAGAELMMSAGPLAVGGLAADTSGIAIVWSEQQADTAKARVQWFTHEGDVRPGWPSGGLELGSPGAESTSPTIAMGPGGSRYVAWVEYDSLTSSGVLRLTRMGNAPASASEWSAGRVAVAPTGPEKANPRLLPTSEGVLVSWSEAGEQGQGAVMAAARSLQGDAPRLLDIAKWPDLVRVSWAAPARLDYEVIPERRGTDGLWLPLGHLVPDATRRLVLTDAEVQPGEQIAYRLRLRARALDAIQPAVEIAVPNTAPLAVRRLSITRDAIRLGYSVPSRAVARFDLFDVQGRRVAGRELRPEHSGESELEWPTPERVRSGVYFARLRQAGETRTRRYVLAR